MVTWSRASPSLTPILINYPRMRHWPSRDNPSNPRIGMHDPSLLEFLVSTPDHQETRSLPPCVTTHVLAVTLTPGHWITVRSGGGNPHYSVWEHCESVSLKLASGN